MIEVTAAVMQIVIQHVSDSGYLVDLQELSFLVFGLVLLVYFDLNQIVCFGCGGTNLHQLCDAFTSISTNISEECF